MNILRRFGLSLAAIFFSLSISALIAFVSFNAIFGTPQPLEQALSSSGIYSNLVQNVIDQQTAATGSRAITSDPIVQQALTQALPPTFIQSTAENLLNSTYSWAQGNATTPNLSIDLTKVKTDFANNIAAYTKQKLDALPPCSQVTMTSLPTTDDILSLSCLPAGVSTTSVAEVARQNALTSGLLPSSNTLNINDAIKNNAGGGRTLTDQLSFVPTAHQYYLYSLYATPILIILFALAIIFWSATKRSGIKRVAWLLITTGITSVLTAVVGVWLLDQVVTKFGASASVPATLQDKLLLILQTLVTDLHIWWIWFGVGYIVFGIILLIIIRLTRPKIAEPISPSVLASPQASSQLPVVNTPGDPVPTQEEPPILPRPIGQ